MWALFIEGRQDGLWAKFYDNSKKSIIIGMSLKECLYFQKSVASLMLNKFKTI